MRIVSPILAIVLMTACGKTDEDNDGFDVDVDCNDTNAAVFPGATEKCDGVDNDCDGNIDSATVCADCDFHVNDGNNYLH